MPAPCSYSPAFVSARKGLLAQPHSNTLNLDTGKASMVNILPQPPTKGLDFPQLRQSLVGRKNRFGYFTGFDMEAYTTSVVKLDLDVGFLFVF